MTEPQNVSGLMDQIHDLKQQLADAEKRGAVKALRTTARDLGEAAISFTPRDFALREAAHGLLRRAARIDSGQVTP